MRLMGLGRINARSPGVTYAPLAHRMQLVAMEAEAGGASGALYAESLSCAIASRYLSVTSIEIRNCKLLHPLPRPRLRRILEKLHGDYDTDVNLAQLTELSGYSRAHFLKMFRLATGKTPPEYLKDIRLDEARMAILDGKDSVVDIAAAVGFSTTLISVAYLCATLQRVAKSIPPHAVDIWARAGPVKL